jgi:hypothetical protein
MLAATQDRVQTMPLAGGDFGTAQTVAVIRRLVDRGIRSPLINRTAIEILHSSGVPQFNTAAAARAIFAWTQANTRFVPDMVGKETLRSADEILRVRAGDCDDLNAVLLPSLLGTVGIPSRLVTIARVEDPSEFAHIYIEANLDGAWTPMDVARPGAQFGLAPAQYSRKRLWSLTSNQFEDIGGLAGLGGPATRVQFDPRWRYLGELGRGGSHSSWHGHGGGHGHGGRGRGMRGGLGFDWGDFGSSIAQIAPAIGSATANIIAAERAAPQNIIASSSPYAGGGFPGGAAYPPSAAYGYAGAGYSPGGSFFGNIPPTYLLIGGALLLVVLMRRG